MLKNKTVSGIIMIYVVIILGLKFVYANQHNTFPLQRDHITFEN